MFESGRYRFIAAGDPSGIQACMVCEELLQPAVRQRMSEQPFDCRKGACRHIGARIETLDNMMCFKSISERNSGLGNLWWIPDAGRSFM